MSQAFSGSGTAATSRRRVAALLAACLPALLWASPPETRLLGAWLAPAACAVLLALVWRPGSLAWGVGSLLLGAGGVAIVSSETPSLAVGPVSLFAVAGLFWVAGRAVGSEQGSARLLPAVAIAGALPAVHGLYQAAFGLERTQAALAAAGSVPGGALLIERAAIDRSFAAFSTPAALGLCLALSLPATVGLLREATGWRRLPWLLLGLLQLAALATTLSITAVLALALAVGLLLLRQPSSRGWVLASLGAAALALVVLFGGVRGADVFDPGARNSAVRLRLGNFRSAATMVAEAPLRGVGLGAFGDRYPQYRRPGDNETRHAHNLPLELAAECGVVLGLGAGLLFFGAFLAPLLSAGPLRLTVGVGLAAFALHNLADFTALMPSLLWSAALIGGWSGAPPGRSPRPQENGGRNVAPASWWLPLAAALAALPLVIQAADGVARQRELGARWALAEQRDADAARLASASARWAPWRASAHQLAAGAVGRQVERQASSSGRAPLDEAAETLRHQGRSAAERAIRRAPYRASAYEQRARWRLLDGDLPGALADLARAHDLDPMEPRYRDGRAQVSRNLQEIAEGALHQAGRDAR